MSKCLAVDYGLERTGLAISDPEGKMAFPLATLRLRDFGSRAALLDNLACMATDNSAEIIVLGMPLHMDGNTNLMCRQVRNFAERLRHRTDLPIYFEPEALTSEMAIMDLAECRVKRKKIKNILDQQAACQILNAFLQRPVNLRIPFG